MRSIQLRKVEFRNRIPHHKKISQTMSHNENLPSKVVFHSDFEISKKWVYDASGLTLEKPKPDIESSDYGGCSFLLDKKTILFRVAKTTPKKVGQFVTLWKRNKEGVTRPYADYDNIDFVIISSRSENHFGQFIFPKVVLVEKGIMSQNGIMGKRGIRVYPPWDLVTNKQATKTQKWQCTYFLSVMENDELEHHLLKRLLQ